MRAIILVMIFVLALFSDGFARTDESRLAVLTGVLQMLSNEGEPPTYYLYSEGKLFRLRTTNLPSIGLGSVKVSGYFLPGLGEELFHVETFEPEVSSVTQPSQVSTGNQRTLVVLSKFSDVDAAPNSLSHYRTVVFEKMNEYFREASFGQVSFEGEVLSWLSLPRSHEYYVEMGRWGTWAQDAISLIDADVTFSENMRLVLVGNKNFRARGTVGFWSLRTGEGTVRMSISWIGADDKVGVYAHEMGHNLGLPDLYDVDGDEVYIGKWDIMAEGTWNNGGDSPAHFSVWSKIKLGWIPSKRIFRMVFGDENQTKLDPAEVLSSEYQAVRLGIDNNRYYLVETRRKIGYDSYLPDEGVLVTYVDESIPDGKGPVRAIDSNPSTKSLDDATFDVRPSKSKTWLSQDKLAQLDVLALAGESYTVKIFHGDRIVVDRFIVEKVRVDVGTTQTVRLHGYWARNQSDAANVIIEAAGKQTATNRTGWTHLTVSSTAVGKQDYPASSVKLSTGTEVRFLQEAAPSLIWDRVMVKLTVTRPRIDVGTNAEIQTSANYQFDGTPFVGTLALSDSTLKESVGSYTYKVKAISDYLHGLSAFQSNEIHVIFDKVKIVLSPIPSRISVGETANIDISAKYLFDGKPFTGTISLTEGPKKESVGSYDYAVKSITDREHGITAFESNAVGLIFDRVSVNLKASRTRIDVGSEAPIIWEAFHQYDGQKFRGEISLNHPRVIDKVGEVKFKAAAITDEQYSIKAFTSNELAISFDRVVVTFDAKSSRIQAGRDAGITWQAFYELDNTLFNGMVGLNEETKQDQVGRRSFRVASIKDPLHGLTSFRSNEVTVIFDKIVPIVVVDSLVPFTARLTLSLSYLYDGAPVEDARVYSGTTTLRNLGSGTYEQTIMTFLPYLGLIVDYSREDFESQSVEISTVAVGNSATLAGVGVALLLVFGIRPSRKKKRKLLVSQTS